MLNKGWLSQEVQDILRRSGIDVYANKVAELHISTNDLSAEKLKHSLSRRQEYTQSDERNFGRPALSFVPIRRKDE